MDVPIIYEDDLILVINKPAGIVVNRATSVKEETIQDWLDSKYDFIKNINKTNQENEIEFFSRSGMVHRIDKETSGILLIAKNATAFINLQSQFKEHIVNKTYIAITHGKIVPETGEINAPLGRLPWDKERFGVVPGGKESVTKYHVIKIKQIDINSNNEFISVVELYPLSGRTHQIRVHLKYINHPILGDYLYAGRKTGRNDRMVLAPRVMLHAWKINFIHPVNKETLAFTAPIPDDMNSIIK